MSCDVPAPHDSVAPSPIGEVTVTADLIGKNPPPVNVAAEFVICVIFNLFSLYKSFRSPGTGVHVKLPVFAVPTPAGVISVHTASPAVALFICSIFTIVALDNPFTLVQVTFTDAPASIGSPFEGCKSEKDAPNLNGVAIHA